VPTINKPALRDLYLQLSQSPTATVDTAILDRIVAIVGDISSDIATRLASRSLTPEQKLAIAKKGLDAGEAADLKALLADSVFAAKLDPAATNFIRAIVGLETLVKVDDARIAADLIEMRARPRVVADRTSPAVQAADKLRELIKSGKLGSYYDVMIGAVDDPTLKATAEALFSALPIVTPGMSAEDFVKAGLWSVAPRGVDEMQKSARYLPGRQVLVETTVRSKVPARSDPGYEDARKKIGTYDPNGTRAVTYRGALVGADPTNAANFLVKVDGADQPISVTKESIFSHNQRHELGARYIISATSRDLPYSSERWRMDYAEPLAKAKLCEIALKMDEHVKRLDFTKTSKTVDLQKACVEIVFRSIDMKYTRDTPFKDPGRAPDSVANVARQAIRGTGMCVQQSTVFGGLLTPFMDILGIDGQYRSGNCFRNIRGATDNVYAPDYRTGHGWWQITFRPSMEMTVTDRTWNNVNFALDRAYGFPYGDRYANTNIIGFTPKRTTATDVNVTGEISVATVERQFSRVGDGREGHISLRPGG
jgi:hypothetical protein